MNLTVTAAYFGALVSVSAEPSTLRNHSRPQEQERRSAASKKTRFSRKHKKMEQKVFVSLLSRAQGTPECPTSAALGNAIFTYLDMELCMRLAYDGLSTPELYSHIHGPAMIGEASDVVFTLSTSPIKVDCFTLDKEQEDYLVSGMYYVNVHTDACPSGEIRGQILIMNN
jgi:hypothetical protein